jgi:hypothetical protein
VIVIAVWANFFVSLISAGFAIVALYRPTLLSQSIGGSTDDRFFVFMYAARSIPFGILPLLLRGLPTAILLFAAALVQVIDIAIAIARKRGGMAAGASVAAVVHVLCGMALL